MADPVTLQTLMTYLTLISVPVGVIYHIMTLRNTRQNQEQQLETRQAQLFMHLYNRCQEAEFWTQMEEIQQWEWDNPEEYYEKYESRPEIIAKWYSVGTLFEGMGVLVKRNLIDVTIVDDLLSGPIMSLWQKWEPTILERRRRKNMPTIFEWFEYLYEEIKKVSEKEHGAEHVVDVGRLERPYESNRT